MTVDALFQLPLADFTAARNALAASLKKSGRASEAEQVKAMSKPSATAWAVNQLFWRHAKEFERLLNIGEKVRQAAGSAADVRPLLEERRTVVSELTDRAAAMLREAGHAASLDATRRMATTLETLASRGRANAEPQAGRLTADLEPLGFDDLAALLGGRKLEPAKVLQFASGSEKKAAKDAAAARERSKEAVKEAEKALKTARQQAQRAEAAVAKATQHAAEVEQEKREIEARLQKVQEDVRAASREFKDAAKAVSESERALERARAAE